MNRYYSDSDDGYLASRDHSDNVRASGWQTPMPTSDEPLNSSSATRIIVEPPFGSKKCDYTIDKSQRGRLIVTARRRRTFPSDYFPSTNNNNNTTVQTFNIPYDADVDRLQSHVENHTNRLIIEIPRTHSSYVDSKRTYTRSPDLFKSSYGVSRLVGQNYSRKNFEDDDRKFEYRIDCQGYTADELDVFIQDRDLIVEGRNRRPTSMDPTHQHTSSKQFSRKISLPPTVDLSKVMSYFENGELRIEAPLKRGIYYSEEETLSPAMVSRRAGGYTRVHSPLPGNHRRHYRRRERISRHHQQQQQQPLSAMQRVCSDESLYHPRYDDDDDDDHRYRRRVNYERYNTSRHDSKQQPLYRSIYEPPMNGYTTRTTTYRTYPNENEVYYRY